MGRKALGKEQVTRRVSPETALFLRHLEEQGITLDGIVNLAHAVNALQKAGLNSREWAAHNEYLYGVLTRADEEAQKNA